MQYFVIDNLGHFLTGLESRSYAKSPVAPRDEYASYSKTLSGALTKIYHVPINAPGDQPVQVQIEYHLARQGQVLRKRVTELKRLNFQYRTTLPIWKTKRPAPPSLLQKRRQAIDHFLEKHGELISCYRYQSDPRHSEGNVSFNLQVATTPRERAICLEFVKALLEAYSPQGLVRGRRQIDKPRLQRDAWIRRYAGTHRKRGWMSGEILKEIQRELREGTWNERSRLQYNLALNTIGRIAGLKTSHPVSTN